jgi:broad specificity phosphatase PhoE
MPTTVLLIRHPESAWNRQGIYQGQKDAPLSPLGKVQAALVAARLRGERISGIVSSPLHRARALADAIGRHHDIEPRSDERLTEISHGAWEGLTRAQVQEQYPELLRAWQERPQEVTFPGGESLANVHDRSINSVATLLSRTDASTWVVVTHDAVARLLVAAAQGRPVSGFASVSLENAAITTMVGPHLQGSVRTINDISHLGTHRVQLEGQAL